MFVSIVMATDDSARFPAASVARITTMCAPSARCNLAVGSVPSRVQPPPSTATSKRSTPEPESEADQVRVASWLVECPGVWTRSEEHTSELQSPSDVVCRLRQETNNTCIRTHHDSSATAT